MSAILNQILTPQMRALGIILILMIIAIYFLSIVWVARDARLRSCDAKKWTIVAIVPIVGLMAYLLLRPSMYAMDHDEQELEVALKQRQLMEFGECAKCGYPVRSDYIVCPSCETPLRNVCSNCARPLDPSWQICPYCATKLGGSPRSTAQKPGAKRPRTRKTSSSASASATSSARSQTAARKSSSASSSSAASRRTSAGSSTTSTN